MEDRDPRRPSVVEELLGRTRHFLTGMVSDYLQRSLEDLLRWILGRSLRYAVSAGFFILASAFLLLGAFEGLLVAGLPRYAAHLIVGGAALLGGLLCLQCLPSPPGRK